MGVRIRKVSATIDGDVTGTLAAPSDLACPYVIFIETLCLVWGLGLSRHSACLEIRIPLN